MIEFNPVIPELLLSSEVVSVKSATVSITSRRKPGIEAEIHPLPSAMFIAQAIICDMERRGREEEIEQISRTVSEVAPELQCKSANGLANQAGSCTGDAWVFVRIDSPLRIT